MNSGPFDSSTYDVLEAFGSEMPVAATEDPKPAFMRTPTMSDAAPLADAQYSVFVADGRQRQTSRASLVATVSVVLGVIAGFAGGYAVTHPGVVRLDLFTSVHESSGSPHATPSAHPTRQPERPVAAAPPDATIAPVPATPSSARRESPSLDPSTRSASSRRSQLSTTRQQHASLVQPTNRTGAIEVQSHPAGARVLLDGSVIGQAPLSIPGVAEGTHEIRLELAGFNPWVTSVRVKGGSRARVGASLAP